MKVYRKRNILSALSINSLLLSLPVTSCLAFQPRQNLAFPRHAKVEQFQEHSITTTSKSKVSHLKSSISDIPSGGAKAPPPQPSLNDLVKFALPCLALWIASPLLSLVDTAAVGLTAKAGQGAVELGALGPATTFIDGSQYLFAFLNVATTNLYASALAKNAGNTEESKRAGDAVVRTAIKISLFCGVGIMALLLTKGKFLLSIYAGEASKLILEPATKYVHIRALSMPTSLLSGVLQAALLGSKDSVTPLIAVIASTIVNVFGDGALVVWLGMGSAGAAIATLAAQWAGTICMIPAARRKLLVKSSPEQRMKHKVSSRSFLGFAAPVVTLILGKLAAFGMMTHVAAALPGEAALASHQIVLSLFFFISPFLEVLSQTAQTFLPAYAIEQTPQFKLEGRKLAARLLRLGMIAGLIIATIAASIPYLFPMILTNDALIQSSVRPLALPLLLGGLLTAPVAISEGVLLARRELKYLASVYVFSTIAFPFGLFKLKTSGGPVSNVWYGFVLFQMFRALCFTGKIWGREVLSKIVPSVHLKTEHSTA
jgi:putative MATE family efflux protein